MKLINAHDVTIPTGVSSACTLKVMIEVNVVNQNSDV